MHEDRYAALIREFLGKKRIAIWGLEATKHMTDQLIANRFRKKGIEVIAVNPGSPDDVSLGLASSLTKIEPPVEAVFVFVDPPQAKEAVDDCIAAGIPLVWLHDALSPGAATPEAIDRLRASGCTVIPGMCPMLYLQPVDPAHFCLKWILRMAGKEKRIINSAQ